MPDVRLEVVALQGIPEIGLGDDLASLLLASAATLRPGDILAVSSKVISKAAGLSAEARLRDATVQAQTVRVVAERRTPRGVAAVVESAAGPVMAAAGVDASNTATGSILLLPADPDAAARELRAALRAQGAPRIAVVVTDTAGRAWRTGQTDFALGCAGLVVTDDLRGTTDASGTLLEVTERAIADEVAAAADLVKGKTSGIPAALVRGLATFVTDDDGPGARSLLRAPASDWFRLGHVEAVRASLGVVPGQVEAPSVLPESLRHRAERALAISLTGISGASAAVSGDGWIAITCADRFVAGLVTARVMAALWCEDLRGTPEPAIDGPVTRVRVTDVL